MTGNPASVQATTAKIGTVSYEAEPVTGENILPGWGSGNKKVTIKLKESDYDVKYECYLNVTSNEITDLKVAVNTDSIEDNTDSNTVDLEPTVSAGKTVETSGSPIKLASGTLKANSASTSQASFNYVITFPETGTNQDLQQDKTVNATVSCKLESETIYYNASNTTGTTEEPKE